MLYPQTEYFNFLYPFSIKFLLLLKLLLNVNDLTFKSKIKLPPDGLTVTVAEFEYPKPDFITITSVIFPLVIIGLSSAPDPLVSLTIRSGIEKNYPS